MRYVLAAMFLLTIPLANWLIGHVGTCVPDGPCLIPVAPGLMAPSGVLMIGLALALRDAVQGRMGPWVTIGLIGAGGVASALVAPVALALASAAAFVISELADFLVYTPLRRTRMVSAVLFSGVAGAVIDSVVFLSIAFGSLDYLTGQVVGKLWMSVLFASFIAYRRRTQTA